MRKTPSFNYSIYHNDEHEHEEQNVIEESRII